jgi:four helix bundle protein
VAPGCSGVSFFSNDGVLNPPPTSNLWNAEPTAYGHRRSAIVDRPSSIGQSSIVSCGCDGDVREDVCGTEHALAIGMRAKKLDEIRVFRKSQKSAAEISALLDRPAFRKNFNLKNQLSRSTSRVPVLIAEGYGQLTDRHFAVCLGRARGSVQETIGHLEQALAKKLITTPEYSKHIDSYDHIGRMLTRWINYLQRSNWRDRH